MYNFIDQFFPNIFSQKEEDYEKDPKSKKAKPHENRTSLFYEIEFFSSTKKNAIHNCSISFGTKKCKTMDFEIFTIQIKNIRKQRKGGVHKLLQSHGGRED